MTKVLVSLCCIGFFSACGPSGVSDPGGGRGGSAPAIGTGGDSSSSGGENATGGASETGGATATGGAGGTFVLATAGPPETGPTGYGRATTGGGSASAMSISSMEALQAAITAYSGSGGLVINYTGKVDFASVTDPCTLWQMPGQIVEIKAKNDITIMGADGSSVNFGLHIASSSKNIIVRNMTFGLLPGGELADAISVEGMSSGFPTDIWIDHNELFSSLATCPGAGDSSFDGLIDFKKGADRVTVSYNHLHDHHKVTLNGFTDTDTAVRHITFHHNVFDNIASRTPLQRSGFSHLYNNVFSRISTSGINIRMGGYSLIEANFFMTVKNAVTSRDSDALGFWDLRNNNVKTPADFATYGLTWSPSDSSPTNDATDWTTTGAYPQALGYSYTASPAACMKGNLLTVAGAGKKLATLKCN